MRKSPVVFFWKRPPPPLFLGGAEITQNDLAVRLASCGDTVMYYGSLEDPNYPTEERYNRYLSQIMSSPDVSEFRNNNGRITYQYKGVLCVAVAQNQLKKELESLIASQQQGCFVTSQEESDVLVQKAAQANWQTVGWLHSVSETGLMVLAGNPDKAISTSRYVADIVHHQWQRESTVIYPAIGPAPLRWQMPQGGATTFINPVPQKGMELFLSLANTMPERRFLAVEGWYRNETFLSAKPANVAYLPPQTDMRKVWQETRLLLVPSQVEEAFGRVVVEAGQNGIPSIVSNKGGLAEALNGSGSIVQSDNPKTWKQAIESYDDRGIYTQKSQESFEKAKVFDRDTVAEFNALFAEDRRR